MDTQHLTMPAGRPAGGAVRLGLWALVAWAAGLFIATITHQPSPQTQLAAWSRYVTTPYFVASHLAFSILGAAAGTLGMVALAVCLTGLGRTRGGLWAMVMGVTANTLLTAVFGVAAFAQPAIGRLYLAGHTTEAHVLYDGAAQGAWLVAAGAAGVVLLAASLIVFGVAVARSGSLPRLAGIGLAISGPLFAIIGFALDDFIESIGAALMIASAAWIANTARHTAAPAPANAAADLPVAPRP